MQHGFTTRIGVLLHAVSACGALAMQFAWQNGFAQETPAGRIAGLQPIAPFRITGVDGYAQQRYLGDEYSTTQQFTAGQPAARSKGKISLSTTELFLMSHGYVYHPGLLTFDLGGGPVLEQDGYDADGVTSHYRKPTYNLSARASLLRDKPYRGGMFYDRRAASQGLGPAESLVTTNEKYGLSFAMGAPVTPVPFRIEVSRSHMAGTGTSQVIDEKLDEVILNADRNLGSFGTSSFHYLTANRDSRSGSTGIPVFENRSRRRSADLLTNLKFGDAGQYLVNNNIRLDAIDYTLTPSVAPNTRDFRFDLGFQGIHSDSVRSFARLSSVSSSAGDQSLKVNSVSGGFNYTATPRLRFWANARAELNSSTLFKSTLLGASGTADYRHELPVGEAALHYGLDYFVRDQQATAPQVKVIGERISLTGASLYALGRPQVVAGSVVVSNSSRTQVFVEGVDYVLSHIGLDTRIQRTIGGNILDAQEVLVDYEYDTGGTYAIGQLNKTLNLTWRYKSFVSLYFRQLDSEPRLVSGTPSFPINPVKDSLYGVRTDLPFSMLSDEILIGGNAESEKRNEAVSPYQRRFLEVYTELPMPWIGRGSVRLGARRTRIEYQYNPDQGVNLRSYNLRVRWGFRNGLNLSLAANRDTDTGMVIPRRYDSLLANARWRIRRVLMTLDVARTHEAVGGMERTRNRIQFVLRRDF